MDEDSLSRRRLLGALGTALAGAAAGCTIDSPGMSTETPAETPGAEAGTPAPGSEASGSPAGSVEPDAETGNRQLRDETAEASSAVTDVYREVVDSVAAVRAASPGERAASGTAWVYDEDTLVTNEHVVSGADAVSVFFEATGWLEASVAGTDVYSDLAVVETDGMPETARPLELATVEPPIGTRVVAVGNPFGLTGSISTGVVSGRNRALPAPNGFSIPDAVQTDAPVNPGNSGGPLVDMDGTVVGVVNSGGGDNIGFAISAAMVRRVVPALRSSGNYEHPYMGVSIQEVTPRLAAANGLQVARGLYVHEVVEGGPSEGVLRGTTGTERIDGQQVRAGGDVIVRMGRTDIYGQQTLSTFLALETSPGDTVEVTVLRGGDREQVLLELGARPDPE
ncbi:MAG: serine protease [Halobacteriales archaeon SW_9_67_25]|nr:MAG: serine protease [Halobacteriales archaeon SW_9_67_25]